MVSAAPTSRPLPNVDVSLSFRPVSDEQSASSAETPSARCKGQGAGREGRQVRARTHRSRRTRTRAGQCRRRRPQSRRPAEAKRRGGQLLSPEDAGRHARDVRRTGREGLRRPWSGWRARRKGRGELELREDKMGSWRAAAAGHRERQFWPTLRSTRETQPHLGRRVRRRRRETEGRFPAGKGVAGRRLGGRPVARRRRPQAPRSHSSSSGCSSSMAVSCPFIALQHKKPKQDRGCLRYRWRLQRARQRPAVCKAGGDDRAGRQAGRRAASPG